jgi:L-fuconolactonase
VPSLYRRCLIEDDRQACGPVAVAKRVFLQCECDPGLYQAEADWLKEVAQADPRIRGIVTWAPLEKSAPAGEAVAQLASHPLIRGIRRLIQSEADPEFCRQPELVRGVSG